MYEINLQINWKGIIMAYTKEILTLSVEIADAMLRNGAEIYRIEETVIRILKAYDIESFDVYVLSNGIFASANEDKEDACSMIRHVPLCSVNLGKITALNQLARDICAHRVSLIDSWDRLDECKKIPDYNKYLQYFFCGLGSAGFCFLFGGGILDSIFAFFIGYLEQIFLLRNSHNKMARFIKIIFASIMVSALSLIPSAIGLPVMRDKMVIGAIMPLVPGIAFTTAIRDFYNGDYLSGTIHIIDALITAVSIALGVCIPLGIAGYLGGGIFL